MLWDYRYSGPSCPTGCTGLTLPANSVAECPDDYKLSIAELRHLYISSVVVNGGTGKIEASTKPSNWLSSTGYAGLTHLVGFGDLPAPDGEDMPLPGFENRKIDRAHTLNFDVTDAKDENLDLVRLLQCGKQVAIWAITHDGIAIGGADGIVCQVDPKVIYNRGKTPVTANFVFTWNNKFQPEMKELTDAPASLVVGPGPANFKAPPPPPIAKKSKKAA